MSPDTNGNPPNVVKRKKKVNPNKICVGSNPLNSTCNCYANAHICNRSLPLPDVSYYSVASSTNTSHMLSLPSLSSGYNYNSCLFDAKTMPDSESPEYSSLPTVNMQLNEAPTARRFSDPGLPNDSDSSTSTIDEGVVHKLKSQIDLLGENNRRLTREVDQLKLELNLLKQHNFKNYGREYEPGLISDIIREVRDATKVREDAFFARVKHLMEEQQQQLGLNHMHFLSEKQKNNDRISKLEEQLKNSGLVTNRVENNSLSSTVNSTNSSSARQVLELEREALELRRELQDTRAKKEASDQKVLLLDKKIQNLMRCDETQSSDVSDDSKIELESVCSRENTGNNSLVSQNPRITLSGPVTDL
ncbi:unnamed protein product [Phyllotreta striolata]|uniref:Uncharacterized protein n=1 Tax=Phyllotreta striolata TaxID=444603 RepID=A0A9N9XVU6_PHYSR|nr:unnamed protein product [Phyllotreta striolata]